MISESLIKLFQEAKAKNASDLYLSTGSKPYLRIGSQLIEVENSETIDKKLIEKHLKSFLPSEFIKKLETESDIDLSLEIDGKYRFRVNIFVQSKGITAIFHLIPIEVPSLEELQLPESLKQILHFKSGLVLFCGASGCGKSTTQAAIIDEINSSQSKHILTLEDPIEFKFKNKKSLIHQREIDTHTKDFHKALRASMREDPDIISIGDIRDCETIKSALTIAETGHLVLACLHASSASQAINRILDTFSPEDRSPIRKQLSQSLQLISYQELNNESDSGPYAEFEILINNEQIQNLIRQDKIHQIPGIMEISRAEGMQIIKK